MTPDSLASLSDSLFSITVALYSLAVVAFCAQLAFGRRPARSPELVAAGGGAGTGRARDGGTRGGPPGPPLGRHRDGPDGPGCPHPRGCAGHPRPGDRPAALGQHVRVRDGDGVRRGRRLSSSSRCAPRGCGTSGCSCLAPVVLALVLIGLFLYAEAGPLVAALRSSWLAIHVSTAIIGFGIFFVSGIASILYLVRSRYEARLADGEAPESGSSSKLPGRGRARPGRPPHRRLRLPDLDLRRHRRRHLGRGRVGPLLGLGPEGDLGLHRLGRLRRVPARPHDRRLAGPAGRLGQRRGSGRDDLQPALRQHGVDRAAQLRRRLIPFGPLTERDRSRE